MPEESFSGHSEALAEESKTNRFFASQSSALNDGEPHFDGKLIPSPLPLSQRGEGHRRAAFTLAETLIVLVILGIVAAITVPALVRNQMDAQNRTRLRKAMTVYDMAINKIVVENQLKSDEAVYQLAPKGDCHFTAQYFKVAENVVENGNQNLCKFRTNDGVWWDISDILRPVVGLRADDLNNQNSDTRFQLLSHFDKNGALRVDDLAYEQAQNNINNINALGKLFAFINGEEPPEKLFINPGSRECSEETKNEEGKYVSCYLYSDSDMGEGMEWASHIEIYDEESNLISGSDGCNREILACDTIFGKIKMGDTTLICSGNEYDCHYETNTGAIADNCLNKLDINTCQVRFETDKYNAYSCKDYKDVNSCSVFIPNESPKINNLNTEFTCDDSSLNNCYALIDGLYNGNNCNYNTGQCESICFFGCVTNDGNGNYTNPETRIENINDDEQYLWEDFGYTCTLKETELCLVENEETHECYEFYYKYSCVKN